MSYTSRHRHKTRRERYQQNSRNIRITAIIALLAGIVLIFKNWVYLYDTIRLWFY